MEDTVYCLYPEVEYAHEIHVNSVWIKQASKTTDESTAHIK